MISNLFLKKIVKKIENKNFFTCWPIKKKVEKKLRESIERMVKTMIDYWNK